MTNSSEIYRDPRRIHTTAPSWDLPLASPWCLGKPKVRVEAGKVRAGLPAGFGCRGDHQATWQQKPKRQQSSKLGMETGRELVKLREIAKDKLRFRLVVDGKSRGSCAKSHDPKSPKMTLGLRRWLEISHF